MARLGAFLRDVLTPLVVLALGGVVAYDHLVPREPAAPLGLVDGRGLGRKFAASMGPTFADGWLAAADALEQGKAMADAQAALQVAWQAGRGKAFEGQVAPEFAKVLAEGAEPTSLAQRLAVIQLWRDFAAGLKGGR